MNKKLKRIVAIIALVFAAVFTVSFMCYLIDDTLLNGAIGGLALGSGAFMLALWFVIKIDDRGSKVNEANEQMVEEEKKEAEKSLSSGNSAEEKNEPSNKGE